MMPEVDDWVTPAEPTAPAAAGGADDWVTPETQPAPAEPHHFGIMDTWPVRLAKSVFQMAKSGFTLPHDVLMGDVNPTSPEGIQRAADLAQVYTMFGGGINPAVESGDLAIPGMARRPPPAAGEIPPRVQAAQTSAELGEPLSRGMVSPNPVVRGLSAVGSKLPFVGTPMAERTAESIAAAGRRVGDIAETMRGETAGRYDVGEAVRPGLQGAIDANNAAMDTEFNNLRGMIDPEKGYDLSNTKAALKTVRERRIKENMANPDAGLENVTNLVKEPAAPVMGPTVLRGMQGLEDIAPGPAGVGFNTLQRARSRFGSKIPFGTNPGHTEGERSFLYGAMSRDMENIARQEGGEAAADALKTANTNAAKYIDQNETLQKLLNTKSNEKIAQTLIGSAAEKTGNIDLLRQLKEKIPAEQFQVIGGQILSELGHDTATNSFRLNQFSRNWNKLSPAAKDALYEPGHVAALNKIANMGSYLKSADKLSVGTEAGHAVGSFTILEHLGDALAAAATGKFGELGRVGAGIAGGWALGRFLGKPASASAIAEWTRAAELYNRAPSVRTRVGINIATRNLISNIPDLAAYSSRLANALAPDQSSSDSNQPPTPGGSTSQRLQVRVPAEQNR